MFKKTFPLYHQHNSMECGVACIKMIAAFYGKKLSNHTIRSMADFERSGTSMLGLCKAAQRIGIESDAFALTFEELISMDNDLPCIVHWNRYHFVVLYRRTKKHFYIADPGKGLVKYKYNEFRENAMLSNVDSNERASVIFFKTTAHFDALEEDETITPRAQVSFYWNILHKYRNYFFIIATLMSIALAFQFAIPYFTRSIVDIGISSGSLQMVFILAIGQAAIIFSRTFFDIVRSRLSLHLSTRINFELIVRFLDKTFRLPLIFLESRRIGDLMQRLSDNYRIESFITNVTVSSAFSLLTILLYSSVLCFYDYHYLIVFLISSAVYLLWNLFFLKKRQRLDWKRFEVSSKNQSILIQMFSGINDLRINSAEKFYFSIWERNQQEIISSNFNVMQLNQTQQTGATVIYEITQVMITLLSAQLVINNEISFGTMLAIQFIMGQLMGPMGQLMSAVISGNDAKNSLDRLMDIWNVKEEKDLFTQYNNKEAKLINEPVHIEFKKVYFNYLGQENQFALDGIDLIIPKNKITAVVGMSGSGKTTLLKILLGYYTNYEGQLIVGDSEFREIDITSFRASCGIVLQESFIFNDTIANNITLGLPLNMNQMRIALDTACILDYVDGLPMKINTLIGNEGKGLSQGQKQRLLIARAIYKAPNHLFLDEATNSLDAKTEAKIFEKLKHYFVGKTVIMIAHRLSTVQHADKIVVLDKGKISEEGTHDELLARKSGYYNLIKAQVGNSFNLNENLTFK